MKIFISLTLIIFASISIQAQNFEDLEFGSDSTFEAITWNIEWFPKEDLTTVNYVTQIIFRGDNFNIHHWLQKHRARLCCRILKSQRSSDLKGDLGRIDVVKRTIVKSGSNSNQRITSEKSPIQRLFDP